jgi:oligopeptide/dipeptide ABC transporter ATP-binding protein
MKRREFLKSMTAMSAASVLSAPALHSPAKAQARNETLLLVSENGPNNLDIHGVGTNRPGYEASWNCYDRLIVNEKKTLADGSVFAHPLHPYTQALVAAVPRLRDNGASRLRLSGEPMSPIDPDPAVCRFYGRCPRGMETCRTAMPQLRRFGERQVACDFAEETLVRS